MVPGYHKLLAARPVQKSQPRQLVSALDSMPYRARTAPGFADEIQVRKSSFNPEKRDSTMTWLLSLYELVLVRPRVLQLHQLCEYAYSSYKQAVKLERELPKAACFFRKWC